MTKIVLIGANHAGTAAANTILDNYPDARLVIFDRNSNISYLGCGTALWVGRQIDDPQSLFYCSAEKLEARKAVVHMETEVTDIDFAQKTVKAVDKDGHEIEEDYDKLILATGARERFLPFPGWTLPNVFGAGGLQAMVKGGFDIAGRKVVIAGTGPLLLAVADYLKEKGANVLLIAEQAPATRINKFALGLWRSPSKLVQAVNLRRRLLGIKYLTDWWITSVGGKDKVEYVELTRNGKTWTENCELVSCGFHLVPNNELATLLGCKIESGLVVVDDLQKTSADNISCAGETTGIGGVEAALIGGKIAGLAASGQMRSAATHLKTKRKTHKFADALNRTFELRDELKTLAAPDTIVCRCEDVAYQRLNEFTNSREAKLHTRCGMGPCQGRVCGAATEFLFGWKPSSVRAPIFPVNIEQL